MKMITGMVAAAVIATSSVIAVAQPIPPVVATAAPTSGAGFGTGIGLGGLGAGATIGVVAGVTVFVGGVVSAIAKSNSGSH